MGIEEVGALQNVPAHWSFPQFLNYFLTLKNLTRYLPKEGQKHRLLVRPSPKAPQALPPEACM